jgi:uncharacterized protein YbaR (Trm112 family)
MSTISTPREAGMGEATGKRVNIAPDLLAILCCPETKQEVSLADETLVEKLNAAVERGELKNKAKKPVTEKLDGGLVRADRKIVYPIREDIPVMLIEEGIPLDQIA